MNLSRVVLVGTGRLAHGMIPALKAAGTAPVAVFGREASGVSAWLTAWGEGSEDIARLASLKSAPQEVDAFVLAVSDDALEDVSRDLPEGVLRIHFAGSGSAALPGGPVAVVWPIHTFTGSSELDWSRIHVAVSSPHEAAEAQAVDWARRFAGAVTPVREEQRLKAHVAAVFAANYTNRMFTHAQDLATEAGLPWEAYVPLVQAVCSAASAGRSAAAQTGPARRGDRTTLSLHSALLSHQPARAALYAACAHDLLPHDAPESSR